MVAALAVAACSTTYYVPDTVGFITHEEGLPATQTFVVDLRDGRRVTIDPTVVKLIGPDPREGDLLLMGSQPHPWYVGATESDLDGPCVATRGADVHDAGDSIEFTTQRPAGTKSWIRVPKADGFDPGSLPTGGDTYTQGGVCLDEQGRAIRFE